MADDVEKPLEEATPRRRSVRKTSLSSFVVQRNAKLEKREKVKKVSDILRKPECERTAVEKALVKKHPDVVKASQNNAKRLQATKDRVLEIEDEPEDLTRKCDELAELIGNSSRIVVYTGAGISTAASIPDYRGPNGVWTLLKKGQELSTQDLSDAEPTFTHMSITKLFRTGRVKHVVSQNCDGLHIRSGYPRYTLSEVHGNMYIECCYNCEPHREYIRLFDVTENTGVRRHTTKRKCRACGKYLTDTIVHFGEKGKIKSPYRWKEAVRAAKSSDLILCLGSSLKILRRYTCLWCMDKKPHQRPKLVIVNLQWTPKDDVATLKINGRCDDVMERVMAKLELNVPDYRREFDPIFKFCTPLRAVEKKTTTKKILVPPSMPSKASVKAAVAKSSNSKKKGKQSTNETVECLPGLGEDRSSKELSTNQQLLTVKEEKEDTNLETSLLTGYTDKGKESKELNKDISRIEEEDGKPIADKSMLKEIKSEVVDVKMEPDIVDIVSSSKENEEQKVFENMASLNESQRKCGQLSINDKKDFVRSVISSTHTPTPGSSYSTSSVSMDKSVVKNTSVESKRSVLDQLSSSCPSSQPLNVHSTGQSMSDIHTNKSLHCISLQDPNKSPLNSSSTKGSDSFQPEVESSAKHDSIGVLLVSQPPECLTDVCSLDLNSDNPSVFPVCRIELPAVNETLLKDDVSRKVDNESSRVVVEDALEDACDICHLGLSVESDDVPSTVVIDLEMVGNTANVDDGNKNTNPHFMVVDLDLDKPQYQNTQQGCTDKGRNASINLDMYKNANLVVDLNKSDLQQQPHDSLSFIKPPDSLPSRTQQTVDSSPPSASMLNSFSAQIESKSTVMADLRQEMKSVPSSSTPSSKGSKDYIHFSSTSCWPSQLPQNTQLLTCSQPSSQSSQTSLKSPIHVPTTAFSLSPISLSPVPKSPATDSIRFYKPSPNVSFLPSQTNTKKCMEQKPLPQVHGEPEYSLLIDKNVVKGFSQQPSDLKEKQFRKVCSQISSISTPFTSSWTSSSSLSLSSVSSSALQTPCFENSSSSSLLTNHYKSQVIPNFQQNKNDLKDGSHDHKKILEILNNAPVINSIEKVETLQQDSTVNYNKHDMKTQSINKTTYNYNDKRVVNDIAFLFPNKNESHCETLEKHVKNLQPSNCLEKVSKSEVLNTMCNAFSALKSSSHSLKNEKINPDIQSQQEKCLSGHGKGENVFCSPNCSQVSLVPKLKSSVASYVLNMDDLLTPKSFLPSVSRTHIGKEVATASVVEHIGSNISLPSAQERAFSPESQKPNQATSLVSKVPCQGDNLEHSIILSENTDIPFKDDIITDSSAKTNIWGKVIPSISNTIAEISQTNHWVEKCTQRSSRKRPQNRGAIVLKADWGTPLTTVVQQQEAVGVKKPKTCNEKWKNVKCSSKPQEHSYNIATPSAQQTIVSNPCELDANVSGKRRSKKTKTQNCKPEKGVERKKKKEKNCLETKTNKRDTKTKKKVNSKTKKKINSVTSSLPGWFGKGLNIKIKRKRKC